MASIDRLRALDLTITPSMDEKTRLIRELMALGREHVLHNHDNHVPEEDHTSFLRPEIFPRVRAIGLRLHEINPRFLFQVFDRELQVFPGLDRKELEYAWNGIGNFLA